MPPFTVPPLWLALVAGTSHEAFDKPGFINENIWQSRPILWCWQVQFYGWAFLFQGHGS